MDSQHQKVGEGLYGSEVGRCMYSRKMLIASMRS